MLLLVLQVITTNISSTVVVVIQRARTPAKIGSAPPHYKFQAVFEEAGVKDARLHQLPSFLMFLAHWRDTIWSQNALRPRQL